MATTAASKPTLAKLTEKFNVEDYRQNPRGYTYIPIEKHIARWNDVCGSGWMLAISNVEFSMTPGVMYGSRNPKQGAYAIVTVAITAELDGKTVTREGVGGDFGSVDDTDKIVKTALAEAIKKAGNEFGIGLELWDEEERALIEEAQKQGQTGAVGSAQTGATLVVVNGNQVEEELAALKNRVADIAVAQGVDRTGPAIAAHFKVAIDGLQDRATLEHIIAQHATVAL